MTERVEEIAKGIVFAWDSRLDSRTRKVADLIRAIATALAQAEREREALKDCHDPLDPCRSCIKCLSGDYEHALNRLSDARAEVERLKERHAQRGATIERLTDERDTAQAEVERLKVENQSLRDGWKANNEAVTVLTADLARVRAALREIALAEYGSQWMAEKAAKALYPELTFAEARAALEGRDA